MGEAGTSGDSGGDKKTSSATAMVSQITHSDKSAECFKCHITGHWQCICYWALAIVIWQSECTDRKRRNVNLAEESEPGTGSQGFRRWFP